MRLLVGLSRGGAGPRSNTNVAMVAAVGPLTSFQGLLPSRLSNNARALPHARLRLAPLMLRQFPQELGPHDDGLRAEPDRWVCRGLSGKHEGSGQATCCVGAHQCLGSQEVPELMHENHEPKPNRNQDDVIKLATPLFNQAWLGSKKRTEPIKPNTILERRKRDPLSV